MPIYTYIVKLMHRKNYYTSDKGFLKECDKEENVAVTGVLLQLSV
jgi:hypothetical protein